MLGDFELFLDLSREDGETLGDLDSLSETFLSLSTFCALVLPLLDWLFSLSLLSSFSDLVSESGTSDLSICISSGSSADDSFSEDFAVLGVFLVLAGSFKL